jgi:hypothetical protein
MSIVELCSGRRPQNAVLCRGIARPDLVMKGATMEPRYYSIPEHVPVFTTAAAMTEFMNPGAGSKRSRDDADANLIPIIAHMGVDKGGNIDKDKFTGPLIFVGISYGEASETRPTVSIAMGGLMPMVQNPVDTMMLKAGKPAWWDENAYAYGRGTSAISIAVLTNDSGKVAAGDVIQKPDVHAFCGVSVLQSTQDDIAVLLGVPPQKAP